MELNKLINFMLENKHERTDRRTLKKEIYKKELVDIKIDNTVSITES